MKPLSETYKELGIDFSFPIEIKDAKGNVTYFELASEVEDDSQSQLDASSYHGHSRDYVSLKIFTEQLERENADLRKDKERLDWLEKSDYELYEPNTDLLFAEASREAIDEAMEEAL